MNIPFDVLMAASRKTAHPITFGELDEIAAVIAEWAWKEAEAQTADLRAQLDSTHNWT